MAAPQHYCIFHAFSYALIMSTLVKPILGAWGPKVEIVNKDTRPSVKAPKLSPPHSPIISRWDSPASNPDCSLPSLFPLYSLLLLSSLGL
jgi:hypothetical protein